MRYKQQKNTRSFIMLAARQTCLVLLLLTLLGGCAQALNDSNIRYLPDTVVPGPAAQEMYNFLRLERAKRQGDLHTLLEAANAMLDFEGSHLALADAAAWLLGNRYHEQARELLQNAVSVQPDDLTLQIMLAETLISDDDYSAAIDLLVTFLDKHPNMPEGQIELALLYLQAERHEDALAVFEALPDEEHSPAVYYYQSQAYRMNGELEQAAIMLRKALEEAPDFVEATMELALVEEELGNYAEAADLFESLLAFDNENQDILLRQLTVALKAGNPERAYQIATSVPDSYSFILTASTMFMDEGRYDLADSLLALVADNQDVPQEIIFYQAAVAYEGRHDLEEALTLLSSISEENHYWNRAVRMRIQILYESGEFARALELAETSTASFPSETEYGYLLMELYQAVGQNQKALEVAEQMLDARPDEPFLAFRRAFLLDLLGDKDLALAEMEKYLISFPDYAPIINYIGYSLAYNNTDLQRSLELLERAVELAPDEDYIVDSLAWVHYRLGNYELAWELIQRAKELSGENPMDSEMWEHYGDIAYALELFEQAGIGWTEAISLNPPNKEEIQAKLEQL